MKKQRPILMSTPMVMANLSGIKTQTRRKVKFGNFHPDITHKAPDAWRVEGLTLYDGNGDVEGQLRCPYGQVGDILWVRETLYYDDHTPCWGYQAGNDELDCEYTGILERTDKVCIPSIHMPYVACRLWLEITAVRVERLQDISEADAIAEGVASCMVTDGKVDEYRYQNYLKRYDIDHPLHQWCHSGRHSYETLFESINGRGSWSNNPYVWVIEYKIIDKPVEKEVANG